MSVQTTEATGTTRAGLPRTSREVHLAARPHGAPTAADFVLVDKPIPALGEGQILVRNTWMSVDPYMRGRMDDRPSYIAPFQAPAAFLGVLSGANTGKMLVRLG